MANVRGRVGLAALLAFGATPAIVWAAAAPLGDRFDGRSSTLRSAAMVCGLLGYGFWAANIIQGARIGLIERAWKASTTCTAPTATRAKRSSSSWSCTAP